MFSESDLRLMRGIGNTDAGVLFTEMMEQKREGFINGMLRSRAEDVAAMSYGQAGAQFSQEVIDLLTGDIDDILAQHNIQPEEE